MKNYLLLIFAAVLFSMGCDKTEDPDHDEYNPTITITSPAEGAVDTVGNELSIEAEIDREDNKIIHNVSVIIEDADGNIVETLVDNEHIHAEGHHHIHEHYHPADHGEFTVRIITTDHDDTAKKVEATRSFTILDAESYEVTVEIQEPLENTTINVNDDLAVKVVYTHDHGGTIHHVKIEILDDAGNVVATLDEGHVHAVGTYVYENANAFTATTAGVFKVVAKTFNHDMSIVQMAERTFTVQ